MRIRLASLSVGLLLFFPIGVVILSSLASPARADLVTNGNFETPIVPLEYFTNFLGGSTGITGWTVVGPAVSVVSTNYAAFGFTFPAEDGTWQDSLRRIASRHPQ